MYLKQVLTTVLTYIQEEPVLPLIDIHVSDRVVNNVSL